MTGDSQAVHETPSTQPPTLTEFSRGSTWRVLHVVAFADVLVFGLPAVFSLLAYEALGRNARASAVLAAARLAFLAASTIAFAVKRHHYAADIRRLARAGSGENDSERSIATLTIARLVLAVIVTATVFKFLEDAIRLPTWAAFWQRFAPVFSVCAAWTWMTVIFVGFGLPVYRLLRVGIAGAADLFGAFWIGWAVTQSLLVIVHFVTPISVAVAVALSAAAATGLATRVKDLRRTLRVPTPLERATLGIIVIAVFWLADACLLPPYSADSGGYDFGMIRWALTEPTVPGLANVHFRFGFNSAYYQVVALFSHGPWSGQAHAFVASLFMAALLAQTIWNLANAGVEAASPVSARSLSAILTGVVCFWGTSRYISSPNPDHLLFPLGAALMFMLIRQVETPPTDPGEMNRRWVLIALPIAAGVATKLSFAGFGIGAAILAAGIWWTSNPSKSAAFVASQLSPIVLVAVLVLIPWMIRGVVLSGYPVFPSTAISFDVDWRVPAATSREAFVGTYTWARGLDISEFGANVPWFDDWVRLMCDENPWEIIAPLGLSAILLALVLVIRLARGGRTNASWAGAAFLIPPGVAILFWFVMAPAPQFEGASLWLAAAVAAALLADELGSVGIRRARSILVVVGIAISLHVFFHALVGPGLRPGISVAPRARVGTQITNSGLKLFVPLDDGSCWDAPQPCTPFPNPHLRLRGSDLSSGFRLE